MDEWQPGRLPHYAEMFAAPGWVIATITRMNYWLVKSEPESYAWAAFVKDQRRLDPAIGEE